MPWEVFGKGRERETLMIKMLPAVNPLKRSKVTTGVISLKQILRKDSFLIAISIGR